MTLSIVAKLRVFRRSESPSSQSRHFASTIRCSAWNITSETRSTGFGPLGARRFHSVNHSRNGFHRVALATLEHAVLEPSDTGVYSLQVHAFPALRARRTFGRQQLRQCTAAHGCTPSRLRISEMTLASIRRRNSNFCDCVPSSLACGPRSRPPCGSLPGWATKIGRRSLRP